ncbi:hypothetical protein [Anaerolentibacter hominis]|uniref:hypothetical protein n=1 Tax=Anaerolentibacter hominis TaxID=3079009 RepID=UPI0031B81324
MSAIKRANKKIESAVTGSYKKVEHGVVSGYKKIEDKFVETFLAEDGETTDEAKARLRAKEAQLKKEADSRIQNK